MHKARAGALTLGRRARKKVGERDPVDDFMFEYYPYTPTKLETWFPGIGITLEIDSNDTFDFPNYYSNATTCELEAQYLIKNQSRIESTLELLRNTQRREATFNCFGLHEWAMVYQADQHEIRHGDQLQLGGLDEIELELTDANYQMRPIGLHAKNLEAPGRSAHTNQINRFVFFDLTAIKRARELQRISAIAFESQMGICVVDSQSFWSDYGLFQ